MAEEKAVRRETSEPASPEVARSLTGSAALDMAMHAADNALQVATGAVALHMVNKVIHRPPQDPPGPQIELPPGVEK
jgi:hypothetical protein